MKLAAILNDDDRGKHLLTRILGMAHDDDNEENRMIAVRVLLNDIVFFVKEFSY